MKYEWKKEEKSFYLPKEKPTLIDVPKSKFFCIKGKGDPNTEEFSDKVGALYTMAYAVRMMPRNGFTPDGYFEYAVYPLEGMWDLTEKGRNSKVLLKEELIYTIMIKQPEFVTKEVFDKALEISKKKKPSKLLDSVYLSEEKDGLSVQMMHIGSYDDEPNTFEKMVKYIDENNLEVKTLVHKEIYISDARKTVPEKRKTVLRYQVKEK